VIGISVIGLGNALQPHARSLVDLADRVRVVWAAETRGTRLKDVADRYGFPTTTDVTRAIGDPAVDAVLVLTPANAHLPVAEAAFAAGKRATVPTVALGSACSIAFVPAAGDCTNC
jgi:predicted dehydrogenase